MKRDAPTQRTHTALVVICITFLAFTATVEGSYLLWKGFAGGGELVMTLNTAISGLIGFLGGRISNSAQQPAALPDMTISGEPPSLTMTQPKTETEP